MYLVTGGAGFIGSHLVEALVERGERVRVFDNFSTGRREFLRPWEGKIEVVEGDLRELAAVRRAVEGVEFVLHQAALRSVLRSVDDPLSTDDVNVRGTLHLLVASRDSGTVRRLVYASSSSVYGDRPELPKREDQLPSPISPYAVSKLTGEYYCRVFSHLYGLETVSLRYFNVFGPRQSPESKYAAVIPLFLQACFRGEPAEVHGDGLQSRDFTYIDNVVEANLLALAAPGVAGEVFNVACGERHTLLEILDVFERFSGRPIARRHTAPRPGDVRHTEASIEKARERLGYRPKVGFEEGLRRTYEYFRRTWGVGQDEIDLGKTRG
ncbi:MAG: UDP-glucose 4-epimerase-like protein [Candidatus Binatia bacterium]|nr:MAG: UDP-glucose 4-epimerase-like protein [Candidatus Binatia bacterium]